MADLSTMNPHSEIPLPDQMVTPLTLGIISDPPSLVLIYEKREESQKSKKRKRKIPLRQFTDKSNVERFAHSVRLRHEEYLGSIPPIVIEKMLKIIQEIIKGLNPDEAVVKVHSEYEINPNEDLNKLPQDELNRKKLIMDETFEKHRLRPTDPDYKYDKQVDFPAVGKVKSGWDDDEDAAAEDDVGSEDKIETLEHEEEDDFW